MERLLRAWGIARLAFGLRRRGISRPSDHASVAQRIEQEPSNLLVVGSIPARGTKYQRASRSSRLIGERNLKFQTMLASSILAVNSLPRNAGQLLGARARNNMT